MVVYVDGKPIFVQNPQVNEPSRHTSDPTLSTTVSSEHESDQSSQQRESKPISRKKQCISSSTSSVPKVSNFLGNSCKPVAKIPYLLAAAAAAAASNHRKQQKNTSNAPNKPLSSTDCCARSSTYPIMQTHSSGNTSVKSSNPKVKSVDVKPDLEYIQLVSLLKQKNEKLFNPLQNKSWKIFHFHFQFSIIVE